MKINIPNSWHKITIGQFTQLMDLPLTGNDIEDLSNRISVLSGVDTEVIKDNIKGKDLARIGKRMAFLQELPKPKKVFYFYWKWRMYKQVTYNETTTSQMADIMTLNENEENEGARMLNVMSVIFYRGKEKQYSGDRFKKMKEELYDVPFDVALNSTVFFLNGLTNYLKFVLEGYSKLQEKMNLKQMEDLQEKMQKLSEKSVSAKYINGMTSL